MEETHLYDYHIVYSPTFQGKKLPSFALLLLI